MSWKEFQFSNVSLLVWEMRTEPGGTTTQVLLVAHNAIASHVHLNIYVGYFVLIQGY